MCLAFPSETSAKEPMTVDRTCKDLLIEQPSRSLYPADFFVLSEPARSMKWKCLDFVLFTPFKFC